jgi:2-dehydropantoate 2-reductase
MEVIIMKLLVVGAGAVGGYFGGRLAEKGENVTFLVRENRKKQLEQNGLLIQSIHGNIHIKPQLLLSGEPAEAFDVILISTKAYHLDSAIEDVRPYIGKDTMILPLLNGMSHIDKLVESFDEKNVLGGLCFVESTLDQHGTIIQTSPIHDLVYGERNGEKSERITRLENVLTGTKANFLLSDKINQEMWVKYLFISTLSGITSLFRSPIGPILENKEGVKTIEKVLHEAATIMRSIHAPLPEGIEVLQKDKLIAMNYEMKSSLQRDMEKSLPIEADHLYGYLLNLANINDIDAPTLKIINLNLKIYETMNL